MSKSRWIRFVIYIFILLTICITFFIFKSFQKELKGRTGANLTFFETVKAVTTQNFDSSLEKDLKNSAMKKKVNNVTIHYNDQVEDLLPKTIQILTRADDKTMRLLGSYNMKPVDLIFLKSEDMKEFTGLKNVSGVYSDFDKLIGIHVFDEDIQKIVEEQKTESYFFQKSILHEYTHYATNRKLDEIGVNNTIFPHWFIEGIAEYVGSDKTTVKYEPFNFKWLTLKELSSYNQWQDARLTEDVNPYLQSYFAINYLLEVYGENTIHDVMERTKETNDFYQALEQVTRKELVDFENDLKGYYK